MFKLPNPGKKGTLATLYSGKYINKYTRNI